MKEFLLIVKTEGSLWEKLPQDKVQEHVEKGTAYIGRLIKEGKIKSAQPLDKGSRIVTSSNGVVKDGPFNETKEVVAGYFHIVAKDLEEAVEIAKANPIFDDFPSSIEVHQMKVISGIND
jgi:hypothetical protein